MVALDVMAVASCVIGAVTDMTERRILNVLTLPLILVGIAIHAIFDPLGMGRLAGLWGMLLIGGPFFVLHLFNVVGAGDVKLLMGIGALGGIATGIWVGVLTILFGGFLSLLAMLATGRAGKMGQYFRYAWFRLTGRGSITAQPEPYKIPMGLAILFAVVVRVLVQQLQSGSG